MASHDRAELCDLTDTYVQSLLESFLEKDQMGSFRSDGFITLCNTANQKTDKIRKKIIRILTDVNSLFLLM